jgi:hypothetical protein
MTRTGVTHTDTASGKGGGQLTGNPGAPSPQVGTRPRTQALAPSSGQMHAQAERKEPQAQAGDRGAGRTGKDAAP